jgi:large subunit ribosomal protein L1
VTFEVDRAVRELKAGKIEFRVDKAGIIHARFGKTSFSKDKLRENLMAVAEAVLKAKPPASKGTYLQKVSISSTMGPGIKIDPAALQTTATI